MKLITSADIVDRYYDPENRPASFKFSSLPVDVREEYIAIAEDTVLGYLPAAYDGLMRRIDWLLLRRAKDFWVPPIARSGVVSYEVYSAAKIGENWHVGEAINITSWPPTIAMFPASVQFAVANVEFGANGPTLKPQKLVELAVRYLIAKLYQQIPALASDPISAQKFYIMNQNIRDELNDLRKGVIKIQEFEEVEVVNSPSKQVSKLNTIEFKPWAWGF